LFLIIIINHKYIRLIIQPYATTYMPISFFNNKSQDTHFALIEGFML